MNYKIICDSGSSLFEMKNCNFESVPLKLITDTNQYIDSKDVDTKTILDSLDKTKTKSSTSCPNVNDYINAFKDAENIFVVTITSALSGSYNSAKQAAKTFENKNIYVIDSLSAGPQMQLIAEKIFEYIEKGLSFNEICIKIENYKKNLHLLFNLKSLTNLANNGRISPKIAKIAGLIGISIIGSADENGKIFCMDKSRGDKKSMKKILNHMESLGYTNGKVKILHCFNEESSNYLKEIINKNHSPKSLEIKNASLICSYYGQLGTVMVSFESGDLND